MLTFFKLFLVCSVAGFLAASLMWVFFWVTGVFEVPADVKKLLGAAVYPRYQNAALNHVRPERQAGMVLTTTFSIMVGSRRYENNSVSGCKSTLSTSLYKQNMA